jgi:phosphoserine phosphatase
MQESTTLGIARATIYTVLLVLLLVGSTVTLVVLVTPDHSGHESGRLVTNADLLRRLKHGDIIITDFDDTVLDGDITFGGNGFAGSMALLEANGVVPIQPFTVPSMQALFDMYGKFPEYNVFFNIALFAGQSEQVIKSEAREYWNSTFRTHVNPRMWDFLHDAEEKGVTIVVLTASPKLFFEGLIHETGWEVNGIEMESFVDAQNVSRVSLLPKALTYGKYKRELVERRMGLGHPIVLGLGQADSTNDRPFLDFIRQNGGAAVDVQHPTWRFL